MYLILCKGTQYIHYFIHQSTPQPTRAYCRIPGDITVRITKERDDCPVHLLWLSEEGGGAGLDPRVWWSVNPVAHPIVDRQRFSEGNLSIPRTASPVNSLFKPWPQLTTYGYIEVVHYRALTSFRNLLYSKLSSVTWTMKLLPLYTEYSERLNTKSYEAINKL